MFFGSIRFKISILYMGILAITLSFFSMFLYHNVSKGLESGMDTLLKSKAQGMSQAIDAYWEASKFENAESVDKQEILRKRRNANFARVAQRWVKEESGDPTLLNIVVKLFDTDGNIIASSKNVLGLGDIPRKNFISVLQGSSRLDMIEFGTGTSRLVFRVFTTPTFENSKVAYIVQIASPTTSIQNALASLRWALFILLPVTVLATGLVGVFLARAALRPVNTMIDTIHQITAENMTLRLYVPENKDEIHKLGDTFNSMLERLESAFRAQKQLFGDLTHELKTPLTILKGEFEVVLKKMRSQEDYESVLRSSLEEVNRITKLVENLLVLARFDADKAMPAKKSVDISLLLRSVVHSVEKLAALKNINTAIKIDGEVYVDGDQDQLKTLFLNLLDNAIKYSNEGGRIDVNVSKNKNAAKVNIVDSGIGIPKEEICNIFDRFYRIDKSRNSKGFGLGLSIAKSIIDYHNGTISVDSCPGKGTAFTVTLPLSSGKN